MNADESAEDMATVPEYEVGQYFPEEEEDSVGAESYRKLKSRYGRVRAWAKVNPAKFRDLQLALNQAGMGTTYDIYLTRCVRYAGWGTLGGLLVGILIAYLLAAAGTFTGLSSPLAVDGGLADLVRANKVLIAAGISALVLAVLGGIGTFLGTYYYTRYRVNSRRRNIDFMLPHSIVYMYALAHGGMNLVEVVDRLADSEDAYGEVAREFDAIQRDIELFGNDLVTALQNRRNLTPSPRLERFLDDFVSVLDTGGDVSVFLENASDTYLEEAEDEQTSLLNTIAVYSEIYVSVFVAAPLFLVVLLMVLAFLGGSTLPSLYLFIYLVFPLGMLGFYLLVDIVSSGYRYPDITLTVDQLPLADDVDAETLASDKRLQRYRRGQRRSRLRRMARSPITTFRRNPWTTLVVTVPLAAVFAAVVALAGLADPGAIRTDPIWTTTMLGVYPFLIAVGPLTLFHEIERGRQRAILDRLPSSLNVLSSANQMGIPFPDALTLLSRYTSGTLAEQFRLARNDLLWSHDLRRSLLAMANRIRVPELSRTMKLLADAMRSSGDISRTLAIAAKDTRNRQRLLRRRRSEMSTYIAVVVIGFLVYLLVVVFLDVGYLRPLEEVAETTDPTGPTPISLTGVPTDTYRMLLFHSVLLQAVGTGLIAGKLSDDAALSGLKYSIALIALALVVFTLIQP